MWEDETYVTRCQSRNITSYYVGHVYRYFISHDRLMGLNESDGKDEEEQLSHPARPSRSLRSNFIRFGRSFFPSAASRSGATIRRSARAPIARRRMMRLVDLPTSLSSSRR